ncbi:hypothetical protein BD413DRAFT_561926 [Trametes elegans]|nr:hypothetical protein BD413DRAFT_561926 [Trametes elegans]
MISGGRASGHDQKAPCRLHPPPATTPTAISGACSAPRKIVLAATPSPDARAPTG